MIVLAKPVCSEVGLTNLVLVGVPHKCWPQLQGDLEHIVHVLIPRSQVQKLRSDTLSHTGHFAHSLLTGKVQKSILALDNCALALKDKPLTVVRVVEIECLDSGMTPVEVDKTDDIEVLIILLKSLLKSGILLDFPAASVTSFRMSFRFVRYSSISFSWYAMYRSLLNTGTPFS